MAGPGLVDRDDLLDWSNTVLARTLLPELIERLIRETTPDLTSALLPSGSGVAAPGFDGTVHSATATEMVPAGLSVWELSTNKNPTSKADDDYSHRLATPDGSPTTDAVYVEVILRPWTGSVTWASERRAEGRWREVRAYNVDAIMGWLRDAPVTHAWLSAILGRNPYGYESAERWWTRWSQATSPAMPPGLLTAGREASRDRLREILAGGPAVITIGGATSREVNAFNAAMLQVLAEAGEPSFLHRAAVVHDLASWRVLNDHRRPLILIPASAELLDHIDHSTKHHLLIPASGSSVAITLERIDSHEAAHALHAAGLPKDEASVDGRLARRSLTALYRRRAKAPALHTPAWAKNPPKLHRGLLLAAAWDENRTADQKIVAELTGSDYGQLEDHLNLLVRAEDPMLTKIDELWQLVSSQDTWLLLASELQPTDLDRLGPVVDAVLLEKDPVIAGDNGSGVFFVRRSHSSRLRQGIAETLAQLGVHGAAISHRGGVTGDQWTSAVATKLLKAASADSTGDTWNSLYDVLPNLAEAAPEAFLTAVTAGASGPKPVLQALFTKASTRSPFGDWPRLSQLLFALEILAWSPEHFPSAADALATLADIEPGDSTIRTEQNHPLSSLTRILGPARPQTTADAGRRLAVLDAVLANHPNTGWRLLQLLVDDTKYHLVHATAEPRFRQWKLADPAPGIMADIVAFETQAGERLIAATGADEGRWECLVGREALLPPNVRGPARERLQALVTAGEVSAGSSGALWRKLHNLTTKHRNHPNATWAMSADDIAAWESIEQHLQESVDLVDRSAVLFDSNYPITAKYPPYDAASPVDAASDTEYLADLRTQRAAAVEAIEKDGLDRVVALAAVSGLNAALIGEILADITTEKYRDKLLELAVSEEAPGSALAWGWLMRRLASEGWDLADQLLETAPSAKLAAKILRATWDYPKAWERAEELGVDVAEEFWSTASTVGMPTTGGAADLIADHLLAVGRVAAAAQYVLAVTRASADDRTALLLRTLQAFQRGHRDDPDAPQMTEYDFTSLFAALRTNAGEDDRTAIAALEFAYLPVLGFEPEALILSEEITNDPRLFVQIVAIAHPPAHITEPEPLTPEQTNQATAALTLLGSIMHLPGLRADGTVDADELTRWITDALAHGDAADQRQAVASYAGQMLVNAPLGADEIWPCEEVRQVLQSLSDDDVERGALRELLNRRGVVARAWDDDGFRERAKAAQYTQQAATVADRWPRAGALLRRLAENYEIDAAERDSTAELRRTTGN